MKRTLIVLGSLVWFTGCGASDAPAPAASGTPAPTQTQTADSSTGTTATPATTPSQPAVATEATAAAPLKPATPAEAAQVLDLRTFSRIPGAEPGKVGSATIARLSYSAPGKVKEAFAHHQQELLKQGWKELPNAYVTDESASTTFARDGYHVSLSVFPTGDGLTISITNHGNVDLQQLPTPAGVKGLYSNPLTTAYVTEASVEQTAAAVRKLLTEQGWTPYGSAGDSAYFRQQGMKVGARVFSAPGQGGKTVIDFSKELLSASIPAPEDAAGLQYSEPPIQLSFDTPKSLQEVHDYYKQALAGEGWEATTENPVKQDFRHFFIFRNQAKDLLEATLTEYEGKTQVRVKFQTAAEVAEEERLFKEALAKKKAEEGKPPAPKAKVALALPEGVTGIEAEATEVKFSTAAGQAKAAAEALRKQLVDAGFEEEQATLEAMFGTASFKKGDVSVTLTYVDTGVVAPEVSLTVFGGELEMKK